jgi:hypothetical protein
MDNYIDIYSNIDPQFCQEGDLEDCKECPNLENCKFYSDDIEECDFDEFEYTWAEMSYYRFTQRTINFKHSELE